MAGFRGGVSRMSSCSVRRGEFHALVDAAVARQRVAGSLKRNMGTKMCGIIGVHKHAGNANVEIYEGLLMLQHRGQDSAGMVTTDGYKFHEYKANGLVKDVFNNRNY
eukprot:jgi/Picre1/34754/NNA_002220.t1